MDVCELAKKYYPRLWNEARLRLLEQAGRLTAEQVESLLAGGEAA